MKHLVCVYPEDTYLHKYKVYLCDEVDDGHYSVYDQNNDYKGIFNKSRFQCIDRNLEWETANYKKIAVKDMDIKHIKNCLRMLSRLPLNALNRRQIFCKVFQKELERRDTLGKIAENYTI